MQNFFHRKRMREARLGRNLTYRSLAARCDISPRRLRDLERGQRALPSAGALRRLSAALGLTLEDLLGGKEPL